MRFRLAKWHGKFVRQSHDFVRQTPLSKSKIVLNYRIEPGPISVAVMCGRVKYMILSK